MSSFEEFRKDIPLLVEAAFIAIKQGDGEGANKILEGIAAIDSKHVMLSMGHGLIALHKMELPKAEKQFLEVLKREPTQFQAKAFLSLTLMLLAMEVKGKDAQLSCLKRAMEYGQDVVDNCEVNSTKELAQSVLDWEKDLVAKGRMAPSEDKE